jgi:hypothetical protein
MEIQFIFPTKTGKIALINGQEIEYNGVTSPNTSFAEAMKMYPKERYEYLGKGTRWNSQSEQHFFKKLEVVIEAQAA